MSFKSWREEFYPQTAESIVRSVKGARYEEEIIVEHSLQKWTGLRPENLKKHNVIYSGDGGYYENGVRSKYNRVQYSANIVPINDESCSLCEAYFKSSNGVYGNLHSCRACPLYQARGRVACYSDTDRNNGDEAPYHVFTSTDNPEPMIKWLEKTLIYVKKQAKLKAKKQVKKAKKVK